MFNCKEMIVTPDGVYATDVDGQLFRIQGTEAFPVKVYKSLGDKALAACSKGGTEGQTDV